MNKQFTLISAEKLCKLILGILGVNEAEFDGIINDSNLKRLCYIIKNRILENMIMQISEHFSMEEMLHSETAQKYGIKNEPKTPEEAEEVKKNLVAICTKILEPLREYMQQPIYINSAYRCKELNNILHSSSPTSKHLTGSAIDIRLSSVEEMNKMIDFIKTLEFDQLIIERNKHGGRWLHVSYNRHAKNRKQILRINVK